MNFDLVKFRSYEKKLPIETFNQVRNNNLLEIERERKSNSIVYV